MAVTPTATGYRLPNGQWVAPTEDFGYGQNPFDPDTQPALYQQWAFAHQGDAQQIGQDYSPGRVGAIIGGTVGAGALGDVIAGGGAAAGASGGGSSTGLVGGAGTIADTVPMATGTLPALPGSTAGTLGGLTPAATTSAIASPVTFGAGGAVTPGAVAAQTAQDVSYAGGGGAYGGAGVAGAAGAAGTGASFLSKVAPFVGLGLDAVSAILGYKAAGQATNQLVGAGQKAQQQLDTIYGGTGRTLGDIVTQQQKNLLPYETTGVGAMNQLNYGMGIPGPPAAAPTVYTPPVDPFGALATRNPLGSTPVVGNANIQPMPPSQPFPGMTSQARPVVGPPTGSAVPRTLADLAAQQQSQSSYVTMRAPTGETEQVPAQHVPFYQSKGAQVVNG